jgi:ABC-type dipeptide/oligopeptide/nickel transport system permease subunit
MAIGVAEAPVEVTADQSDVAGRSLRSIVWGRLRRDKTAMISMIGILIILLGAIFAPLITRLMGVDPYSFNGDLLSDAGSLPLGNWGGITWQHPLGVEPQTGRDIFARLLYGARLSLFIALTATVITMVLGTLAGIVAGYRGGWVDTLISRLSDLTLVFPSLVLLIALGPVAQQWATELGLEPNTGRVVFIILVLGVFSWAYLGRIVRGQVLSLRARSGCCSSRSCRTSWHPSSWWCRSCCPRSSSPRRLSPSSASACCRPRPRGATCWRTR